MLSYKSSQLRNRVNAFSRVLRAAWHDTFFPATDGRAERTTHVHRIGGETSQIHDYRGKLKVCPASGLIFRDDMLLKNSTDGFMRERVPSYLRIYRSGGRRFPELVSLRHGSEANYWHFFQLVATKAVIADEFGIDRDVPLLLSRRQVGVPFIARMLQRDFQAGRPIVVQDSDEVIGADRIHVVVPPLHGAACRDLLLDRLGVAGDAAHGDRLFVTRGRQAENNRMLRNEAEVTRALERFGFRTIDPQQLPLDDQIATFSRCSFMVSPHGAGLTNMIFRRGAPLSVVEIFNRNLVNDCYEIVAGQYGYRYRALYCEAVSGKPTSGNPLVDVDELSTAVKEMLAPAL